MADGEGEFKDYADSTIYDHKKGAPFEILSLFLADLLMSGVHFLAESIP